MLQRIRGEMANIHISEWALTLLAFVPYAVGWIVGVVVRLTLWLIAAIVAGYKAGKGE